MISYLIILKCSYHAESPHSLTIPSNSTPLNSTAPTDERRYMHKQQPVVKSARNLL